MVRMQTQGKLRVLDTIKPGERDREPRKPPKKPTQTSISAPPSPSEEVVPTPQQSHPTAVVAAPATSSERETPSDARDAHHGYDPDDPRRMTGALRGWIDDLHEFQKNTKGDRLNTSLVKRSVGHFLDRHLEKADVIIEDIARRRWTLMHEASSSEANRGGGGVTMQRRRLQQLDTEAFRCLTEIASEAQKKFFQPLCRVNAMMLVDYIRHGYPGNKDVQRDHEAARKEVDWTAIGRDACRIGRHLGQSESIARSLGGTLAGEPSLAASPSREDAEGEAVALSVRYAKYHGGEPGDWSGGRRLMKGGRVRGMGRMARPIAVGGGADGDTTAEECAELLEREANARIQRLQQDLAENGPRDFKASFFDPNSFAKSVEGMLDLATAVHGGRAGLVPEDDESTWVTDGMGAVVPKDGPPNQEGYPNQTFVVQFDLKTFRELGGLDKSMDKNEDEDDALVWMARDRDHYAALLDDDGDKAQAALAALCLNSDDAAVVTAVAFIYREAMSDETFFEKWASGVLGKFAGWYASAQEGPVKEISERAARRVAKEWLDHYGTVDPQWRSEDVNFVSEGLHAIKQLGIECGEIKSELRKVAANFPSDWYLRGVDSKRPATYRSDKFDGKRENYEKMTTALIWSYFLHDAGLMDGECIRGDELDDIRRLCETDVDVREHLSLDDVRHSPDFDQLAYFITHKVFNYSDWGRKRLDPVEWSVELDFLRDHVDHVRAKNGAGDVHLCGEFVCCLRTFGLYPSNDDKVREAVEWIAGAQNRRTGGWEVRDHDLQNSFHATICAVDALITPTMDKSAPVGKVSMKRAGARTSKRQREKKEEDDRRRQKAREEASRMMLDPWDRPHPLEKEA